MDWSSNEWDIDIVARERRSDSLTNYLVLFRAVSFQQISSAQIEAILHGLRSKYKQKILSLEVSSQLRNRFIDKGTKAKR